MRQSALGVGFLQMSDHLGLALGAKYHRAFAFFEFADIAGQRRAAVEQGEQFQIERVDTGTQFSQCQCHVSVL